MVVDFVWTWYVPMAPGIESHRLIACTDCVQSKVCPFRADHRLSIRPTTFSGYDWCALCWIPVALASIRDPARRSWINSSSSSRSVAAGSKTGFSLLKAISFLCPAVLSLQARNAYGRRVHAIGYARGESHVFSAYRRKPTQTTFR